MQNLYVSVLQNLGFTGQEGLLSMDSAMMLFGYFIFNNDEENHAVNALIIYALQICEEEILEMEAFECFRYIGHGRFIEDCFSQPARFK